MIDLRQNADARSILERDADHLLPVYARYPVVMERGDGVYLFDSSGNRYLDFMAGLGVNALGHAHPRMVAAMADQAGKLVHLSPQYASRYPGELAERLCALSGLKGVFYSTGGSEAVEGALKLARTHARRNFSHPKHGIVALRNSYHGRTYGSLSVTGQEKYRMDFGPGLPHVTFVDREDLAQLRAAVTADTAAVVMEPLLGEGGVYVLSAEYMQEARRLADQHGALLILDEIQSGLGRTGEWFAYSASGVQPDVLILGKPLGGGLPLSALLVNETLFDAFGMAKHGSTLGGSPFACRLGLEFLSIVEDEELLPRVRDTGEYLLAGLEALAELVGNGVEARGRGLLLGLDLQKPARPVAEEALAHGFLLNVVQNQVLRFLPPFLLERHHVDLGIDLLHRQLTTGSASLRGSSAEALVPATA
ncbi:MAG TPA: acetylornithine transaminase [Acidobacteriaceae bacterium]|jgi:acetylornithine/succinyldiaminopimelate/putrescine aminotransferase|nr:acetylornithine transaminase [Acidobacteriaceae bacterium]